MLAAASILLPDAAVHEQQHANDRMRLQMTASLVSNGSGYPFLLPGVTCVKAVASILLPDATVPFRGAAHSIAP